MAYLNRADADCPGSLGSLPFVELKLYRTVNGAFFVGPKGVKT